MHGFQSYCLTFAELLVVNFRGVKQPLKPQHTFIPRGPQQAFWEAGSSLRISMFFLLYRLLTSAAGLLLQASGSGVAIVALGQLSLIPFNPHLTASSSPITIHKSCRWHPGSLR